MIKKLSGAYYCELFNICSFSPPLSNTYFQFNKKVFIQAIVETFNDFCTEFPSKCPLLLKR